MCSRFAIGWYYQCDLIVHLFVTARTCSWSNEGCQEDSDCCSKRCWRLHEGTNYRCRSSSLTEPCVFDYHCRNDLVCGAHYNCCSSYWKTCSSDRDCCIQQHVCRPADGFIYNRYLYPLITKATNHPANTVTLLAVFVIALLLRGITLLQQDVSLICFLMFVCMRQTSNKQTIA